MQKEGGLDGLAPGLGAVRKAYVIGREAEAFALRAAGHRGGGLRHDGAWRSRGPWPMREPGDVVLLAPAAASFDQYDNFEQRGDDFTALVRGGLA